MSDKINKKVIINLEELLKNDAPYLVEDGKVNLEKLKGILKGKTTEKEDDRFYFNWAGKDKVFQAIQASAYSTLVPQKDKSIDWDNTENLMIVGENLETLKLLLKPYFGQVKVIYIDPPYNTGKDFIYKDDFSSPLKDYLERTGQKDGNGNRLTTNTEASGRYHSDWLNFMYSRLFMARNLLKDDGVIFISIDDNEIHHLRMIMDDIFGEDNFVSEFIWKSRQNKDNRNTTGASIDHEYILCYSKNNNVRALKGSERKKEQYSNPDNDPRGDWASGNMVGILPENLRPNCHFDLVNPETKINYGKPKMGWRYDKKTMQRLISENRIIWPSSPTGRPRRKVSLSELSDNYAGFSSIIGENIYTRTGTQEIEELFGFRAFDFPKPSALIEEIVNQVCEEDDLVLDFFAGSGSTGHATFALNSETGNRRFILVQIPEPTLENSEAYKKGYKTISDICIDRLKKVSEKENNRLTFKVFELKPSNFNLKEEFVLTENKNLEELKNNYLKELGLYVNQPTIATANALDIVYEIILKNGFSLNSKIEEVKIGSNKFYFVSDKENDLEMYICLDNKIKDTSVEGIRTTEYKGKTFAFYDNALTDSQKINLNTFVKLQVI